MFKTLVQKLETFRKSDEVAFLIPILYIIVSASITLAICHLLG